MLGELHDILHEFPNRAEIINNLHENNPDFAELMDQHDQLDTEIRDLEEHNQPTSDFHMEDLKKKRALLKDKIYDILRHQA
ncbi:MAG: YdcH family protein [Gammaproteobacteria bacterium]|nr:YdcH family protein [Gammaproteobacteria bacterium]